MKIAGFFFPLSWEWLNLDQMRNEQISMIQSLSRAPCFLFAWPADRLELENRFASWKKCAADSQERPGSQSQFSYYFHMSGKCPWTARSPDSLKQMPQRELPFHTLFGLLCHQIDAACHGHINFTWAELGLRTGDESLWTMIRRMTE